MDLASSPAQGRRPRSAPGGGAGSRARRAAAPPASLALRAGVVLATLLALVNLALAQSKPLAREFQAGVDAYRLGEYDVARAHLEKARALDPSLPGPHRFLAAVARAQERHAECVGHAAAAVEAAPQSREAQDTRKLHEECRTAAGRAPFRGTWGEGGALAVVAREDGAPAFVQVRLNGQPIGSTPLAPRALAVGSYELAVGERVVRARISAGIVTDVEVELSATGWLSLSRELLAQPELAVEVDGAAVSPAARIAVRVGLRRVRVARKGARPWTATLEVAAGTATEVRPVFADKKRPRRRSP